MRYFKRIVVVAVVLGSIAVIAPVRAHSAALAPTYNGDGVLSLAERNALNALPANTVTSLMLSDLRESDLPYLNATLRLRITTPTNTVHYSGSATAPTTFPNYCCQRRRSYSHHWWRTNVLGWHLTDYHLGVAWTYNFRRLWDADSWDRGDGHWGWVYCGHNPRYDRWAALDHKVKEIVGRGEFGFGQCNAIAARMGGRIFISHEGNHAVYPI